MGVTKEKGKGEEGKEEVSMRRGGTQRNMTDWFDQMKALAPPEVESKDMSKDRKEEEVFD